MVLLETQVTQARPAIRVQVQPVTLAQRVVQARLAAQAQPEAVLAVALPVADANDSLSRQ